jgi:hypothetical protein
MNSNELISSKILSDVEIIADLYNIVKQSGLAATNNPRVKSAHNDVCVLKPNELGKTRLTAECRKTSEYSIKYDANDITIVGGAALNVYDYTLREFKERRELGELDSYIKKKTSDIDIVWWPRSASNKEIITSKSEAIIQLALAFRAELQQKFNDASKELEAKIKPYIVNASNADELSIYVEMFQTRPAGVFNINVQFRIKDKVLKICDISLHDSGAGQRYDADGNEITTMHFMTDDPVYCNPLPGKFNSITYLNVTGIHISVSNIHAFVNQQMLAFDNLIRVQNPKSLINYKRVEFVKILLYNFKLRNEHNTHNYKELFEVFGTRHADYPTYIISQINKRVDSSILKLYKPILTLCETVNAVNDDIVNKLCIQARLAEDTDTHSKNDLDLAERFAASEQGRLQELKEAVGKRKRLAHQKYKKEYAALYNKIESKRDRIRRMLPSELIAYKTQYETRPDEDITEMERIDNSARREQDAFAAATRERARMEKARKQEQALAASQPVARAPVDERMHRRPFMSAEPPQRAPPMNPFLVRPPPSFISAANIVPGSFGWAPPSPPPPGPAPYYVEYGTNRPMQWDRHYGRFYYLGPAPSGSLLPLPGQPPLPPGLPPSRGQPQYGRRGGTRKNISHHNKTRKH